MGTWIRRSLTKLQQPAALHVAANAGVSSDVSFSLETPVTVLLHTPVSSSSIQPPHRNLLLLGSSICPSFNDLTPPAFQSAAFNHRSCPLLRHVSIVPTPFCHLWRSRPFPGATTTTTVIVFLVLLFSSDSFWFIDFMGNFERNRSLNGRCLDDRRISVSKAKYGKCSRDERLDDSKQNTEQIMENYQNSGDEKHFGEDHSRVHS
ncbi:hypothetical protein PIB30_082229 [Stylosanthes scabra]|uniref:Uncharacterized protein n=1 Tax=Stylosanthes scabra TaxID=79078 RepID=A0ABU6VRS3_9FABA|nr:hypothetical protein [Stylosanthes scabra]